MIERFLKQTSFTSQEDYIEHLEFIVPDHFNFAYDAMGRGTARQAGPALDQ